MKRLGWLLGIMGLYASGLMGQQLPYDLITQGNAAYYREDYGRAEILYRKALEAFPDSLSGDSAFRHIARRLQATLLYNLGNAIYRQKRYQEALKYYQQAAQSGIDDTVGYYARYNMGNALASMKKWDPAIEAYKNVLRKNPYDSAARHNLVYALLQKKKKKNKNKNNKKDNKNNNSNKSKQKKQQKQPSSGDNPQNQQQQKQQPQGGNKQQPRTEGAKTPPPQPHQLNRRQMEQLLKAAREQEKKARRRAMLKQARRDRKGKPRRGVRLPTDKDW